MQSSKKRANKLIDETSPYLLQHAYNPVDWHPWGEEAFEKAKADDKPVLVSIGYSSCHWCHVMERESFEDEATARLMNEHFINIKVDMEERPDVDQIYMTFVQLTTGRGGWPMNVFLTPDKLPFFGGTYFPPMQRYNMPSWQQVLLSIAEAYKNKRDELHHSANDILGEIRRVGLIEAMPAALSVEFLDTAFQSFVRSFDAANGGFGGAPKFPAAMSMEFLLRYWKLTGDEKALNMVKFTARKMAEGGIYDQIGGGFHRYAVDAVWLVPHFEKMLYDNAQLIRVYLHLYQITKDCFFKRIAIETLEYVRSEMLDKSGGFYSTQDADSEGVEGKFFVWTPDEIEKILGSEDAQFFNFFYDVSKEGNFEENNILHVSYTIEAAARALKIEENKLNEILERGRRKLFEEREKRIKPFRDEKILTAWNGLMLAAFAEASAILDSPDYLDIAKRNAEFILSEMQKPTRQQGRNAQLDVTAITNVQASVTEQTTPRLLRTWKDGKAKLNGYIEDYANFADGLIELFQVLGEIKYLSEAGRLADTMITEFWDEESGGFFFTSNDHEELIVRSKDFYDNATPSGNSVAADVLLKLAKLTGDQKYERFAVTTLRLAAAQIKRHPQGFGRALSTLEFQMAPIKEIIVIGEKGNDLEREIAGSYLPNAVVIFSSETEQSAETMPLLENRGIIDGKATAYVCEDFVCKRPVTTVEELRAQIV